MKFVTTKLKSGGLHEKHVVASWGQINVFVIHKNFVDIFTTNWLSSVDIFTTN